MRVNIVVDIPEGITCTGCPYYDLDCGTSLYTRHCRLLLKSDSGYAIPTVKFDKCRMLKENDTLHVNIGGNNENV